MKKEIEPVRILAVYKTSAMVECGFCFESVPIPIEGSDTTAAVECEGCKEEGYHTLVTLIQAERRPL